MANLNVCTLCMMGLAKKCVPGEDVPQILLPTSFLLSETGQVSFGPCINEHPR
ncbi:hypothetical protein BofuT4_uP095110.1 [Botrytis cinerea T4]|uniref:Uncharacterized protein n=1 Tax=Botryotinia fuckeliana (strain T4) TaxID=999810 RepID=G2YDF5_BOTF4|nr:hypothetical protein BofuT4_uP095110.1 [Botrytis cinerea T4]